MRFCKQTFAPLVFLLSLWAAAGLRPAGPALAAEANSEFWQVLADRITHYKNPEKIIADGNVILQKSVRGRIDDSMTISADSINYDIKAGLVEARGNLLIRDGDDEISAAAGILDLKRRTSNLKNARLFRKKDNLHIDGELFEKTGDLTYRLRNSRLTTCETEEKQPPPWSFRSSDMRITKGGYASMKNVSFRIRNTPVLYTPYLIVPAGTERKTGFLFPEFTQSGRDGAGLLTPYFINLSPSHDLTLYPGFLSKRGVKAGLEFRYAAGERSLGFFSADYLHDSTSDKPGDEYKSDGYLRSNSGRYWLRGKVDHDFGDDLTGHLDLDLVSDRDYLQEFNQGLTGFNASHKYYLSAFQRGFEDESISQRENTAQLLKAWQAMDLNAELRVINDVQDEPADASPLWALPRLTFSGLVPVRRSPFELSWETEYIYYWRERGLGAHRLDLHPRLTAPLPFGPYLEANVIGGLRETLYLSELHGNTPPGGRPGDDLQNRTMTDFESNIGTTLVRDYEISDGSAGQWRHSLRPGLGYTYIPYNDQSNLPDLDGTDRVAAVNRINYGLDNFFTISNGRDDASAGRELGHVNTSQAYNLRDSKHPFADLFFELGMEPARNLLIDYENALSVYGQGVNYYSLKGSYAGKRGHGLNIDYYYKRNQHIAAPYFYTDTAGEDIHEISAGLQARLTNLLAADYSITHSFASDRLVESSLSLLYHPFCWSMELIASTTPDDSRLMVVFSLTGIGQSLQFGLPRF